MYSTRKLTEKIWNPFEIRFSTLDLQIKFSRSREVSWILWILVGSVDVDKYVWHVKLWTTDVVRNWRTRQLFENLIFWRHSKLSSIGINVYDHSYFLSAEGETTTITIMVRPKNTARKSTSPKKVKSYFSDFWRILNTKKQGKDCYECCCTPQSPPTTFLILHLMCKMSWWIGS